MNAPLRNFPHHFRAFTLLELLAVMAIIAVLAALLFPVIGKMRQGANRSASVNQLRQIGIAINLYAQENDGIYPKPDDLPDGGFWAKTISRDTEYLGKGTQWLHQGLVAPGVRYPKPSGELYASKDIRMTYCATGAMCAVASNGLNLTPRNGRKLSLVDNPTRAPLIFLARQRPSKDGYSRTVVQDPRHAEVVGDLAESKAEDTVLFNFDLGPMPVLMAGGHLELIAFSELNDFVKPETWQGRVTPP